MGGFTSRGEVVRQRSFIGARFHAAVDDGYGGEGHYYVVTVAREQYKSWVFNGKPGEYRLHSEGVYLPIQFKYRYRASALAKLLNTFFNRYPGADIRKDDDR
jgi:hypothetical protein